MSKSLNTKRKGDLAELHVATRLLSDPDLEVFRTVSDDGHGSDLAVRSTRTQLWYSIQVKAATQTVNPFVYLSRFRAAPDYIVAAVVLDDEGIPGRTLLVRGTDWELDKSGCLGRNECGGKNGPYVEVRTTTRSYEAPLAAYDFDRVISSL